MKPEKAPAVNASAINLVGVAFAVLLGVQILLMPPVSYKLTVLSPYLASTVIMLGLGPFEANTMSLGLRKLVRTGSPYDKGIMG